VEAVVLVGIAWRVLVTMRGGIYHPATGSIPGRVGASVARTLAADHALSLTAWAGYLSTAQRSACRLNALLAELVASGIGGETSASAPESLLAALSQRSPIEAIRKDIALEHVEDLRRLDAQMRAIKIRIRAVVAATDTSLTGLFGVGPFVAAIVIGHTGESGGSGPGATTRPTAGLLRSRSPPADMSCSGSRGEGTANSITPSTSPRSPRSATATPTAAFYDRKIAEGKTTKEALRALKRRISDVIHASSSSIPTTADGPGRAPKERRSHPA